MSASVSLLSTPVGTSSRNQILIRLATTCTSAMSDQSSPRSMAALAAAQSSLSGAMRKMPTACGPSSPANCAPSMISTAGMRSAYPGTATRGDRCSSTPNCLFMCFHSRGKPSYLQSVALKVTCMSWENVSTAGSFAAFIDNRRCSTFNGSDSSAWCSDERLSCRSACDAVVDRRRDSDPSPESLVTGRPESLAPRALSSLPAADDCACCACAWCSRPRPRLNEARTLWPTLSRPMNDIVRSIMEGLLCFRAAAANAAATAFASASVAK
mmetsp:Transcript_8862/g.29268  ORF Transcript_8862/g.29268 Transcript_8862/m.29268 type:complete len:269 (+) Transcript_8862:522-1328(+)